jgi:phosphoribosyl 1,2-cyclic phosphodiesterase
MDDNTTKVVLTAIALAFVLAIMRRFDRVSLHIERLRINIFGLLKISTRLLNVAMHRRRSRPRGVTHGGNIAWGTPFFRGSFALANAILVVPGNHDIDMIVVTHPNDDHLNGLWHFFRCPHHGSR